MIVKIPTIDIETEGLGTLSDITLTSVSLSGSIFEQGTANITFYEKPRNGSFYNVWDMGGKWTVSLDGHPIWTGYAMDVQSERLGKIMKRQVSLVDQTEAWNVLLKDKIYPDPPDDSYTVGDLISDLTNEAAVASGVSTGTVADMPVLLSDLLGDKQYVIRSSTYLAEINKVLSWIGYKLYADPYSGQINVINPNLSPSLGTLDIGFYDNKMLSASFDLNLHDIATTVVVGDEVSGQAAAVGHLAEYPDDTNFDMRKLEKVAFVSTYGVKDNALISVAQSVYDLSRRGSQILSIKFAGYKPQTLLWNDLAWTDANGNVGNYKVSSYTISISPQEITTEIRAVISSGSGGK